MKAYRIGRHALVVGDLEDGAGIWATELADDPPDVLMTQPPFNQFSVERWRKWRGDPRPELGASWRDLMHTILALAIGCREVYIEIGHKERRNLALLIQEGGWPYIQRWRIKREGSTHSYLLRGSREELPEEPEDALWPMYHRDWPRAMMARYEYPLMVFDPFMGYGATALAAEELGWSSVGVEFNEDYAGKCLARLRKATGETETEV